MTTPYDFTTKWSPAIKKKGYVQVPNLLIMHLADLDVRPTELMFLLTILVHRRTRKNPYPSLNTISNYGGKARGTMQGAARSLEKKGLIRRISRGGNKTNEYDITPLINRLESYAQPIEKLITTYRKTNNLSYREINTKEEALKKTKIRKLNGSCGKPTSIEEVLSHNTLGIAIKR